MVNRYFIEPSTEKPDDEKYVLFGLKWLVEQPEKGLVYVPNADKLEHSYFSKLYAPDQGKEFRDKMSIKFGKKNIDVITGTTIKQISDLINIFICWADDHYDKKIWEIEETYNINSILVLPWNPETDINNWKSKYNPTQLFRA